jgi:transposase
MNREPRKQITGAEKLAILRRYLVDKVPISELCDECGLQPSQVYYWQKQLFEQGAVVFERGKDERRARRYEDAKDRQIAQLRQKLITKNEVVAELMEEHVQLKKELGEL